LPEFQGMLDEMFKVGKESMQQEIQEISELYSDSALKQTTLYGVDVDRGKANKLNKEISLLEQEIESLKAEAIANRTDNAK